MQIYVTGSPYETGMVLDKKRLNRQISEAKLIYDGIWGKNGWSKNILVQMYKDYSTYLYYYILTLEAIKYNQISEASIWSEQAMSNKPEFHTEKYISNMKSRLFTKAPGIYSMWSIYGKSYINMYFVNGKWRYIKQKK